ncbi:MAG: DUF4188 domain-containing protein, partial [Actinomycetota bacterium]|nr:DUF4188 domain-containing protein [Actinomycetota bacterium]
MFDVFFCLVGFLIGFRPNRLWKVRSWRPVFSAMSTMLRHLDAHPDMGLLGARGCLAPWPMFIQYWRSFDDLERFSRDPDAPHLESWHEVLGLSVELRTWDLQQAMTLRQPWQFAPIAVAGWLPGYPDPEYYLRLLLHSD